MRIIFNSLLLILLFLSFSPKSNAQTKQGITVTPSVLELDLSHDKAEAEIYYKNNTKNQIELSFSAQDFSQIEETGRVQFILEKDAKNYQYGLTSWIKFEKQFITLSPNEQEAIKIFIDKNRLTPGGHYATVQAQIKETSEKGKVAIRAILSTIIFVRTGTGNEREDGEINTFEAVSSWLSFPKKFFVRFKNSGNVETTPYGIIEVKDPRGKVVGKGILNEGSLIVLPESIRRFDINIQTSEKFLLPGEYLASLDLHFGKTNKILKSEVNFFSLGIIDLPKITGAIAFVLLIIFGLKRLKKIAY